MQSLRNLGRKYGPKLGAAALTLGVAVAARADGTDPFTTALADVTTKVTSYAGSLVSLAAVGVAFMVGIKYVKKIKGAA